MTRATALQERVQSHAERLSKGELRVARFFVANREQVLVASAAELAARIGTSDATVVRTARALGYSGLDALRRDVADEISGKLTPARRVAGTLREIKGDLGNAFRSTLDLHVAALKALRRQITPRLFRSAVEHVLSAQRIAIFGIGPSSAMANYFAIQARRFGLNAMPLTDTGLLLADGLLRLHQGDLLIVMAYGRVYPELRALFDRADRLALPRMLMTDTLGPALGKRSDLVLEIPRGRSDRFSMHTATLAFLEALLVGIAAQRPQATIESLTTLNQLRSEVAGKALDL